MKRQGEAVETERVREAAARLRHDLGKAVRFSAPRDRETSLEDRRARLGRDVLETRLGPGGRSTAVEVFEVWEAEERAAFPRTGPLAEGLERIAAAVAVLRELGPRLAALSAAELERLDEATIAIATECRALEREAGRA